MHQLEGEYEIEAGPTLDRLKSNKHFVSTVPLICEPLRCQTVAYTKQQYRYLSNLDLADLSPVGEELQIDALIG